MCLLKDKHLKTWHFYKLGEMYNCKIKIVFEKVSGGIQHLWNKKGSAKRGAQFTTIGMPT